MCKAHLFMPFMFKGLALTVRPKGQPIGYSRPPYIHLFLSFCTVSKIAPPLILFFSPTKLC